MSKYNGIRDHRKYKIKRIFNERNIKTEFNEE